MIKDNKLQIQKRGSKERVKKYMISVGGLYSPDKLIEDFARDMDSNGTKKLSSKLCDDYQKVAMTLGLDTHLPIADSVLNDYRPFLIRVIRDIEQEYDCKTAIEKTLAEIIASSHVRIIHYSKILNGYVLKEVIVNKDKTDYYNLIGKELDRAHRQLSNSILTLKQIKAPSLPFNINANTAFIAQNQQINTYSK